MGHLFSPDFFDVERYPEIVYESSSLTVNDGALTSEGTLTVKDKSTPAKATGRLAGPAVTLGDVEKIGIDLGDDGRPAVKGRPAVERPFARRAASVLARTSPCR